MGQPDPLLPRHRSARVATSLEDPQPGAMSALAALQVHGLTSPCSSATPEDIARDVRHGGLDAVTVVDHDRLPDPAFPGALTRQGIRRSRVWR